MGTRDRKMEMTGGMQDPVYDSRTGVWQEQAKGYQVAGGGVRIPSGNPDTGEQLGPPQAIDQIVHFTPGDDGVSADITVIPLEIRNKIVAMEQTVEARYVRLAKAVKEIKENGVVNPETYGEAPAAPAAPAAQEEPAAVTEMSAAAPKQLVITEDKFQQMLNALGNLVERVSRMEKSPIRIEPTPKPAIKSAPVVAPEVTPEVAPEPGVQVQMNVEGLGMWQVPYHAVVENGNTLALIFDKRFKSGARFFPPVLGEEKSIDMVIQSGTQVRKLSGFSVGLGFTHGDYEFTIMIIAPEPAA